MKTKFCLASLLLAAMATGCSNEELITDSAKVDDGLVEIGDNFLIASVGTQGDTRTHWDVTSDNTLRNAYLPTWNQTNGSANVTNLEEFVNPDEIGLCWTGVDAKGVGSVSASVYTNYQFTHYGWLGKDQTAPDFDKCSPAPQLNNGWLYSELGSSETDITEDNEINAASLTGSNKGYGLATLNVNELNTNSGVYKTNNKAIFGGDYIAYYPYNESFKDAGAIPAKAVMEYNGVKNGIDGIKDAQVGKATFRYAYAKGLVGGANASGFEFKNLSGLIRVYLESDGTSPLTEKIDQVLLYSASGSFNEEVTLNAAGIAAGKTGKDLFASVEKKSKTILVNIDAAAMGGADYILPSIKGAKTTYITVAALPAEISDLKVLAHDNTTDKWAEVSIGNYTVATGVLKSITATMKSADFKDVYYAVDQASLTDALSAAGSAASDNDKKTVKVLGDVVLSAATAIPSNVIVEGDKLIVPEDITLTVNDKAIIKSAVDVEGQTCCGSSSAGGKMTIGAGATIAGNVNVLAGAEGKEAGSLEFTHTASTTSIVAATSTITSDGNIDFKGQTDIRGTLTVNAAATATLSTADSDVNVKGGTVNNNGSFEVNEGKFAMLDANGQTVASAGKNFKNNGKFIDNVGTTIGGATQYMVFGTNGDYICKVNEQVRLDEAYINKTACSTIQFVHSAETSYDLKNAAKHNNKDVDIVDNSTNATTMTSTATAAVTIGNLSNTATSTSLGVAKTAKPILVNGNIVLNKAFTTAEDVVGMTANNLTVNNGGSATFANRQNAMDVTLAVAQTIEVKEGGSFTITAAVATKNVARVTCKKLIEGGTFTGKPDVIE